MLPNEAPPHGRRLLEQVRRLPGPRIQLWGWPGSGKRSLLAAFAREAGDRAVRLGEQAMPPRLRPEVRWALWEGAEPPPETLPLLEQRPDVHVVFQSTQRAEAVGVATYIVQPFDLLVNEPELARWAETAAGGEVSIELVRRLHQACDGWLRPLDLAIEAGILLTRPEISVETLLAIPGMYSFLRLEVFEPLAPSLRELLLELSAGDGLDTRLWSEVWGGDPTRLAGLSALVDRHGFALEAGEGRRRLPRLIAAFLHRERERHWPGSRSLAVGHRLACASLGLGKPAAALSALIEGGDSARVAALIEAEWPELLGSAAPELLRAALRAAPRSGGAAELLSLALEATASDRRRAMGGLAELAGRPGAAPALTSVARLLLAVARGARQAYDVGAAVRVALGEKGPIPAGIEALLMAVEAASGSPRPRVGEVGSLVEQLLSLPERLGATAPLAEMRRPAASRRGEERPTYRVILFGPPHVIRQLPTGARELKWTLRRALKIFAFLASSPEFSATREEIAEAVWAEREPEVVQANFHPTLSHLRRAVTPGRRGGPEPLLFHQGVYRLNPEIDWRIDTVEFESYVQRARQRVDAADGRAAVEHWQAAWQLYAGPFLSPFGERWVVERREELGRRYLEVLRRLGDTLFDHGDLARAMDAYRAGLVVDPLQERVHLAVMRIYARQARRDLLRQQFARLSNLLREELGAEPMPETTAEFHRLMG